MWWADVQVSRIQPPDQWQANAAPRPTFQTFQLSSHGCFLVNFLQKYHKEGNILGCTVSFFFGGNSILSQRVELSQPDKETPRPVESPLFFLIFLMFFLVCLARDVGL